MTERELHEAEEQYRKAQERCRNHTLYADSFNARERVRGLLMNDLAKRIAATRKKLARHQRTAESLQKELVRIQQRIQRLYDITR